jgi:hypothetical protein
VRPDGIGAAAPALFVSIAIALAACDALGNPPQIHRTPPTSTALGGVVLVTRTETVPAARAGELIARIMGRPHRVEPSGAPFITLAVVDVEPPGAFLPGQVVLVTELATDAGIERHRWAAPGGARPFVALLATRSPPRSARTTPIR